MKAKSKKSQMKIMKKKRKVGGLSKPKQKRSEKGAKCQGLLAKGGRTVKAKNEREAKGWREFRVFRRISKIASQQQKKTKTRRSDKYQIFKHQTS